jgi:uncharacterized protein YqeY
LSLKDLLWEDMKRAMKEKDEGKLKVSVIRMARAAIKNVEIDRGHELSDEETIEVLAREVTLRRDVIPDYRKARREDSIKTLEAEISFLQKYLPKQLSEDEIRTLARDVIQAVGAGSEKDIGKVMSALMPKVKGRADGKLVNQIVREELAKGPA